MTVTELPKNPRKFRVNRNVDPKTLASTFAGEVCYVLKETSEHFLLCRIVGSKRVRDLEQIWVLKIDGKLE